MAAKRAVATARKIPSQGGSQRVAPAQHDQQAALDRVMQLMAIPGLSGEEAQVAGFIRSQLLEAGAAEKAITYDACHKRTPAGGEVGNLIVRLPGTVRKPRRLLMAHLDTVPVCAGSQPQRKGNYVRSAAADTGLGADNRAGCSVVLTAALEILKRDLPHPPLTLLWTVQEEIGLFGARHLKPSALGKVALAFNWDGGAAGKLTIGATGGYRMTIEVHGLASHAGGAPEQGVSAIAIAALAISRLVEGGWHGRIEKNGSTGTSNVGVINGGATTNVVTDRVVVRAEARSHDSRFRRRIVREIESAFRQAAKQVCNDQGKSGSVHIDGHLDYDSFRLPLDTPCVQRAAEAVEAAGLEPELAVANGGLDANWMVQHGIPTVSLGCGQRNIHTVNEQLFIPDFQHACRIALSLASDVS